jgi:hypothetical protein
MSVSFSVLQRSSETRGRRILQRKFGNLHFAHVRSMRFLQETIVLDLSSNYWWVSANNRNHRAILCEGRSKILAEISDDHHQRNISLGGCALEPAANAFLAIGSKIASVVTGRV